MYATYGTASGVYAFGCSFRTPTQGYGGAPSVWGDLYGSHGEARTAAIEYQLKRLPVLDCPHEHTQRHHIDRMRQAVANELRQPSLMHTSRRVLVKVKSVRSLRRKAK